MEGSGSLEECRGEEGVPRWAGYTHRAGRAVNVLASHVEEQGQVQWEEGRPVVAVGWADLCVQQVV